VVLPADLHATLLAQAGHRGLTTALTVALEGLVAGSSEPGDGWCRPAREKGTVEITLRLPIAVADAAEAWRLTRGLSRQASIEYAIVLSLAATSK
jgi:hypothetical protein